MIADTFGGDDLSFEPFIREFNSHIIPTLTRWLHTKINWSLSLQLFSIKEFWSSKVIIPDFRHLRFLISL